MVEKEHCLNVEKIKSYTSYVSVFKPDYVLKKLRSKFTFEKYNFDIFENEIFWLQQLESLDFTPKIIDINRNERELKLTYCGERLQVHNVPDDWEQQIEYILNGLVIKNCAHNDIKPTELLVKDQKIYLIDFGWATKFDEKRPKEVPKGIGGGYRYSKDESDDRYSIHKSLKKILRDLYLPNLE